MLREARSALVKLYREKPQRFPDGIDSALDRWYRPEEWADDGRYLGPKVDEAIVNTSDPIVNSDPPIVNKDDADHLIKEAIINCEARAIVNTGPLLTIACKRCGVSFQKSGRKQFCSASCKTLYHRKSSTS